MNAATSSLVASWLTLVVIPEITGIFSGTTGVSSARVLIGPIAGRTRGSRTSVARIPIMHPRTIRIPSLFVSRINHLHFLFFNKLIYCFCF
jgi:hypothetical protein